MGKRVLIVDDEELVRKYVRRALSSRGWEVAEAANGAAGLELLRAGGVDVLICDLKMPDMRGEDVLRKAREISPDTRTVAITGSVSNLKSPLMPGITTDGVLIKPFGIDEIRALLDKITARDTP